MDHGPWTAVPGRHCGCTGRPLAKTRPDPDLVAAFLTRPTPPTSASRDTYESASAQHHRHRVDGHLHRLYRDVCRPALHDLTAPELAQGAAVAGARLRVRGRTGARFAPAARDAKARLTFYDANCFVQRTRHLGDEAVQRRGNPESTLRHGGADALSYHSQMLARPELLRSQRHRRIDPRCTPRGYETAGRRHEDHHCRGADEHHRVVR